MDSAAMVPGTRGAAGALARGAAFGRRPGSRGRAPRPPLPIIWLLGLILVGAVGYLWPIEVSARILGFAGIGIPVLLLLWRHPELGLIAVSFFTGGFFPRALFTVSLGGLRLDAADLSTLTLLAIVAVRGIARRSMEIPRWSITGPLLLYAGCALFSAGFAWFYQRVNPGLVVGELRPALYCAACAIAVSLMLRRAQLVLLLGGLFAVADMTAGVAILQQFFGALRPLVPVPPDGVWQIDAMGGGGFASVRVVPPGHILMFLMANVACCLLLRPSLSPRLRWILLLQLGWLALGILLSFTRAQWIATGIALLLATAMLPAACKRILGRTVLRALPLAALLALPLAFGAVPLPDDGDSNPLLARATSVLTPGETLDTASLEWRVFEVAAVIRSLQKHPFLGVGLGNDYRDVTLLQGEASGWLWDLSSTSRLTRFAHNGYLYLAVKMGLLTLAVFAWFSLAFIISGAIAYFRRGEGMVKLVALAVLCSFIGLLEWAIFEPHLMLPASMATVGIMVGLVAMTGSGRWPEDGPHAGREVHP